MKEPIFSVIIPSYNAEKYIERCVDSVCTEKNIEMYEVLVVNDGSTDCTGDILDRKVNGKINMQVINSENKGVSHARNEAIKRAEGKYLIFLDSDDYLLDGWCVTALSGVQKDCDFVVFDFIKKYEDGKEDKMTYHLQNEEIASYEYLFLTSNLMNPCWSRLYRKSIIKANNIYFDETISIGEDFLFSLEYFKHCESAAVIHVPFLYKEERTDSVMHSIDVQKYIKDDGKVLTARLQYMEERHKTYGCSSECYLLHFRAITNLLLQSAVCNGNNKRCINAIICSHHVKKILSHMNTKGLPLMKKVEYLLIRNKYTNILYSYLKIKEKFLFIKRNSS